MPCEWPACSGHTGRKTGLCSWQEPTDKLLLPLTTSPPLLLYAFPGLLVDPHVYLNMKFRDGMWLTAEGMSVSYAEEVYSIRKSQRGLSLLCPTKKIRSRGDSLNLPTLTIVSNMCPLRSQAELEGIKLTFLAGHQRRE